MYVFQVRGVLSAILQAVIFVLWSMGNNAFGPPNWQFGIQFLYIHGLILWYPWNLQTEGISKPKQFDYPTITRSLIQAGRCLYLLTAYYIKGSSQTVTQVKQTDCFGIVLIKRLLCFFLSL